MARFEFSTLSRLSGLIVLAALGLIAACEAVDDGASLDLVDGGTADGFFVPSSDSAAPPPPSSHVVKGTIVGLKGTGLVLRNNGKDDLAIGATDTTFTFATQVAAGSPYAVTIATQPAAPAQVCIVTKGQGTVSADVTDVVVSCVDDAFTIGGTVAGLVGSGLVIQNNGADDLTITPTDAGTTTFAFPSKLQSGQPFAVTVLSLPENPSQACTVGQGSGTVAVTDVTNVTISCINSYGVGGTVAGLRDGAVVLQKGADELSVGADGSFSFPTKIASNGTYAVTIKTQPNDSTCTVTSNSGTVTDGDVTTVTVTCDYPCAGYKAIKGCWYISEVSESCNTVCASHGGFDAVHAQHTGNPICTHFYPEKAEGSNWETIECCSTDNNTRWGANGDTPKPDYTHPSCHLGCACNQ